MAVIEGGTTAALQEVDSTMKAARVTIRPQEVLGWQSVGVQTGLITGLAAGGAIFSFRNIGSNPIVVRRIGVGFICTTIFTTAQRVDCGLMIARSFTASDSGGTAVAFTGSNAKHRTSLATLTSVDCRVSTTAALTAGTRTLDANTISQASGWCGALGGGIAPTLNNLLAHDAGDYPLVLAQNEGFIIQNVTAMGALGVGVGFVNLSLAEAASF